MYENNIFSWKPVWYGPPPLFWPFYWLVANKKVKIGVGGHTMQAIAIFNDKILISLGNQEPLVKKYCLSARWIFFFEVSRYILFFLFQVAHEGALCEIVNFPYIFMG